ncbi:MAG: hypothetical protein RQ758_09215 [Methanomicrobiaceae archaeon]|nr:hypothetical protein [Methanomicrobiaceae archaeon]
MTVASDKKRRRPLFRPGNFLVYALQLWLAYYVYTGIAIGDTLRTAWGIFALLLTFVPMLLKIWRGVEFFWPVKFMIALPLLVHITGGIGQLYFTWYPFYDKLAHLVAAASVAFLVYVVLLYLSSRVIFCRSRSVILILILLATMLAGSAWEVAEQYIDLIYNSTYYLSVIDSLLDQAFNLIGAGAVAILADRQLSSGTIEEISQIYFRKPG